MCIFKSGIILKNRVIVAPGANDSHSDLLENLGIEDNDINAMKVFVRAELFPINRDKFSNSDDWTFRVDQDILPEWYTDDPEHYEKEFRDAVKSWVQEHVLIDKKIDELNGGYYLLKRCEVKMTSEDVVLMWGNSTVQEMWGNSTVQRMWGKLHSAEDVGKLHCERYKKQEDSQEMKKTRNCGKRSQRAINSPKRWKKR